MGTIQTPTTKLVKKIKAHADCINRALRTFSDDLAEYEAECLDEKMPGPSPEPEPFIPRIAVKVDTWANVCMVKCNNSQQQLDAAEGYRYVCMNVNDSIVAVRGGILFIKGCAIPTVQEFPNAGYNRAMSWGVLVLRAAAETQGRAVAASSRAAILWEHMLRQGKVVEL